VVLLPFPFTDLTTTKQRPGLIVSSDLFNGTHSDVIVVAITSQVPTHLAADEFLISQAELLACGLPKASILKLSKIVTIHQRLLIKQIGSMPVASLAKILHELRSQF
jgi:mRNA interferase MazF